MGNSGSPGNDSNPAEGLVLRELNLSNVPKTGHCTACFVALPSGGKVEAVTQAGLGTWPHDVSIAYDPAGRRVVLSLDNGPYDTTLNGPRSPRRSPRPRSASKTCSGGPGPGSCREASGSACRATRTTTTRESSGRATVTCHQAASWRSSTLWRTTIWAAPGEYGTIASGTSARPSPMRRPRPRCPLPLPAARAWTWSTQPVG